MPEGNWTLRLRTELRPLAVAEALEAYRLAGNLDGVAARLKVSKRTLERWIAMIPELSAGIAEQRRKWGV